MGAAAPYIVTAVAAAIGHQQQQKVLKRQDELAAQGIRQQAAKSREAAQQVEKQVERIQESAPDTANQFANLMNQLKRTRPLTAGAFSDDYGEAYKEGATEAESQTYDFGKKFADLLSRMDAPIAQRQTEGFQYGDLSNQFGALASEAGGLDFVNRLRMQGVRPNQNALLLAEIGRGYAAAQAGK